MEERVETLAKFIIPKKFDVCVTSYSGIKLCFNELRNLHWKYLIIDEAHALKNEESQISRLLRKFRSGHKLLLTGTPLQNNLHELWSLMNFILPDLFSSSSVFDDWFELNAQAPAGMQQLLNEINSSFIGKLHKILQPFILRRTKADALAQLPPKKEVHLFTGLTAV